MDTDRESGFAAAVPAGALHVIEVLESLGKAAYLSGQTVRTILLGEIPAEPHIVTDSVWYQVRDALSGSGMKLVESGSARGSVTVAVDDGTVRISTFTATRSLVGKRLQDSVRFATDICEDLASRDFTVEAVAWNPRTGFMDPYGGVRDIENGTIGCAGNPAQRMSEDPLLALRAVAMVAETGFTMDPDTVRAVHGAAAALKDLPVERVAPEYDRIVCAPYAPGALREFADIVAVVVPEIGAMIGFEQNSRWHCYDVWEHCLHALEELSQDAPAVLRHATLLHDVGKPGCYALGADGRGHFYGHEDAGSKLIHAIFGRLKWSFEDVRIMECLVKYHDTPIEPSPRGIRRMLSRINASCNLKRADETMNVLNWLLTLKRADTMAHAPRALHRRLKEIDEVEEVLESSEGGFGAYCVRDLAIGEDDLAACGVSRGPEVGWLLRKLLNGVIEGNLENDRDALLAEVGRIYGRL